MFENEETITIQEQYTYNENLGAFYLQNKKHIHFSKN